MTKATISTLETWNTYDETTSYNETGYLYEISPLYAETMNIDDIDIGLLSIEDDLFCSLNDKTPTELLICLDALKRFGLYNLWLEYFVYGFDALPDYHLLRRTHILLRNSGLKSVAVNKCMECLIVLHFKARSVGVPTSFEDADKSVLYNICLCYLCGEVREIGEPLTEFRIKNTKWLDTGGIDDFETIAKFKTVYEFNSFDDIKAIDILLESGSLGYVDEGYPWNLTIDFILSLDDAENSSDSISLKSDIAKACNGEKASSQKIANLLIPLWEKGMGSFSDPEFIHGEFILNLPSFLEDQNQQLYAGKVIVEHSDAEFKRSKIEMRLDRYSDHARWHYKFCLTKGITLLVRSAMQGNVDARAELKSMSENIHHKELILEIANSQFSERIGI